MGFGHARAEAMVRANIRTFCQLAATSAVLAASLSCGPPGRPPSRPATRIYDRSMAQLGVVELVVKDQARAEQAKRVLERVEQAFVEAEARRTKAAELAFGLSTKSEPTDEEIRRAFATMDEASNVAFARYVGAQLELRRVLTRTEFEKLSKVR